MTFYCSTVKIISAVLCEDYCYSFIIVRIVRTTNIDNMLLPSHTNKDFQTMKFSLVTVEVRL